MTSQPTDLRGFVQISPGRWFLHRDRRRGMRVDVEIFASEAVLRQALADGSVDQVRNVACLTGIRYRSLAMPDIHSGYGFSIGGVAAFDAASGVVLPGGVGYDINCGVRALVTGLSHRELAPELDAIGNAMLQGVPTGMSRHGLVSPSIKEFMQVLQCGAVAAVELFGGRKADLECVESGGVLPVQTPIPVSERAVARGIDQLGSLGSGNHFIEFQVVERVFDAPIAEVFGLEPGKVVVMIHTGSRGFGHQVATDAIDRFRRRFLKRIRVPDPQLVCAPIDSVPGKEYLQALNAAGNFAWANRQILMETVIRLLETQFKAGRDALGIKLLYDQAHNIAKFEEHKLDGIDTQLLVHRKGATRAFPPGHADLPPKYRRTGQPVLIPGSMGTASYIMRGVPSAMQLSFGSASHGAGRKLSRNQSLRVMKGRDIHAELFRRGIRVFSHSLRGLLEEAPEAYKDVDEVVKVSRAAGLADPVARLRPLLVLKG
ncbi:MAG: RtcB family protein [Candidatus Aminicenantes bacterium]|nr:RtcB family protein [Candidatus Aminicenantes bacterium]